MEHEPEAILLDQQGKTTISINRQGYVRILTSIEKYDGEGVMKVDGVGLSGMAVLKLRDVLNAWFPLTNPCDESIKMQQWQKELEEGKMDKGWVVIGKAGCGMCMSVTKMLSDAHAPYEYVSYDTLTKDQQTKYIKMAKDAGGIGMPIILHNGEVITHCRFARMNEGGRLNE